LKIDTKTFTTPSNKKIEIQIVSSNFHIEVTPSDLGIYDRIVMQDLIKELAQTRQIDANAQHKFKVVVINEADTLSRNAQAALRRTMEKYMQNLRIILNCTVMSKVIPPIRSRCLMIRNGAPSIDEISFILDKCCRYEKIQLPTELCSKIAQSCNGNLRKALLTLESMYVQQ
jgi:replication factor C subunit 3/5